MNNQLTIIGLMSGTSLDGLDVCCATFSSIGEQFKYEIVAAETYNYNQEWKERLEECFDYRVIDPRFEMTDKDYGSYIGEIVNMFIDKYDLKGKVDLIASHGQTIFHEPDKGITVQIGNGDEIAKVTGIDVINDFRIKDVEMGGQGAPLVPIGDAHLFSDFQSCLNLGGIANISFDYDGKRVAYDICPANIPLNYEMRRSLNLEFDRNGEMAFTGKVLDDLLMTLNALPYYRKPFPKSLGMEWMIDHIFDKLIHFDLKDTPHVLRTLVEHETDQIANELNKFGIENCLVTGGGAFNDFFIRRLRAKTDCEIVIPEDELVEFKEALIFAFLAYLNVNERINTLSSVTGASADSIGGVRHFCG